MFTQVCLPLAYPRRARLLLARPGLTVCRLCEWLSVQAVMCFLPVSVVHNCMIYRQSQATMKVSHDLVHLLQWFILHNSYLFYHITTPPLTLAIHTCTHSHTLALLYIAKRWWAYMSHQNRPTLPSVVSHWGVLGRNGPPKLQCDLCKIPIIGWSDWTKMVDRHVQTKLS